MPEKKYEVGKVYGKMQILAYLREKGRSQYRVKCVNCGREYQSSCSDITKLQLEKYGCTKCKRPAVEAEKIEKLSAEHVGKTYENLTIEKIIVGDVKQGKKGTIRSPMAVCCCVLCGKESTFLLKPVIMGRIKACSCIRKENLSEGRAKLKGGKIDGTNIYQLDEVLSKNNTSGIKGVSFMPKYNKFRAYIMVGRKQIHLGMFSDIKEAEAARKKAEEKYFDPLKKEWKSQNDA